MSQPLRLYKLSNGDLCKLPLGQKLVSQVFVGGIVMHSDEMLSVHFIHSAP